MHSESNPNVDVNLLAYPCVGDYECFTNLDQRRIGLRNGGSILASPFTSMSVNFYQPPINSNRIWHLPTEISLLSTGKELAMQAKANRKTSA